jgi:hypothetical protein
MKWLKRYFSEPTMDERLNRDLSRAELNLYISQKKQIEYYHSIQYYRELIQFLEDYNENYKNGGGVNSDANTSHSTEPNPT